MDVVNVEISGPVLASFHHKFAESHGDFSAILLGTVTLTDYSENTDLATMTERNMTRMVVQKWAICNVKDFIDFKKGLMKLETLKVLEEKHKLKIFGMLRFKKSMKIDSQSFLDRKVMSALLESTSRPCLFILVGEEVTAKTLSIKQSMVTYLLDKDVPGLVRKIPLLVPNLGTNQRAEYITGGGGRSMALQDLLKGSNFNNCAVEVNKNFQPLNIKFKAGVEELSGRITELHRAQDRLEGEVVNLFQAVNQRQEHSCLMKLINGLQGDLKAALEVGLDKSEVKYRVEEKMNSLKLFLSDDED